MTPQEIEDLANGPAPEAECRDVPFSALGTDECDHQASYGTGGTTLYCGAPGVEGYLVCRFHLFDAVAQGYEPSELSTDTRRK